MIRCFLAAVLVTLPLAVAAQAPAYPDIVGVWTGTYTVAFPDGHPTFRGQSREAELEMRITKQEDNLFWAQKRWRPAGAAEWTIESATGTLYPFDATRLSIVEMGPAPEAANTGFFDGALHDGAMHLVYRGIGEGGGVSFAVTLQRR